MLRGSVPRFAEMVHERFSGHLTDEDVEALRELLGKLIAGNGWWDDRRHSHNPELESADPRFEEFTKGVDPRKVGKK